MNERPMQRKIYVAIPVSDATRQLVAGWQEAHRSLPVRWVPAENLHITLIPPWTTDDVEMFRTRLVSWPVTMPTIPFEFRFVESAPARDPRLLWARGQVPDALVTLRDELQLQLAAPVASKQRAFKLHMTIARFTGAGSCPDIQEHVLWKDAARHVTLTESITKPSGIEYEPLATTHLKTADTLLSYTREK